MADMAGVINDLGHSDDAAFAEVTATVSSKMQEPVRAVRDLVFDVLPETVEVAWPRQRSVGWGTGPRKFTEQFAYLMPFEHHVTLGFYRGGELPDPDGLLPSSGGRQVGGSLSMRSLKISSLEDVRRPASRALIDASTQQGVPPPRT
ncbi:MAG: DUF1801 domain-containing protein [Chloroflexi bacterium]|nr:DUF1801 domain-containing protein [Chloroflexota bacterium]